LATSLHKYCAQLRKANYNPKSAFCQPLFDFFLIVFLLLFYYLCDKMILILEFGDIYYGLLQKK